MHIDRLPAMGLLGIAYILLRSGGKYIGAWVGGILGSAEPPVRSNLGLALLSQAGVAIGLALEIVGPIGVKLAIKRAGESGGGVEDFFAD